MAAAALADDASSQHSSDQSDTRTEHSDEDAGDKAPKRGTAVKATKKPAAAAKSEVKIMNVHMYCFDLYVAEGNDLDVRPSHKDQLSQKCSCSKEFDQC